MPSHDDAATPRAMNFERLRQISGGDPSFERDVLEALLAEIPNQLALTDAGLQTGDTARALREAHSLKGSALNIGAETLGRTVAELERLTRAGDIAAARATLARALDEFDELRRALRAYLRSRAA